MKGRVLNSRYELEELIGTGGMADVYRARDGLLGRTVAVKILHPQYAKDEVFIGRFRQEAQAAANLNQPNIVNVYDWGIEGDVYYLVMEYVEGRDLKGIILGGGPLLPERATEIAMSICLALEAAHANGIVHRDIKPQNVIVTPDNQVKVMDFGIARTTGGSALTQTGTIMGTAQYISPEQAQGQAADPRSDLYSLGVVIYEMLTGKVPFDGENPVAIAYKHVREDPLPPSMINPDISPGLEAVVMKALAKNPENRYQSAVEMRSDLERCLEGAPVYATPVLSKEESARGATRAYPAVAGAPRRRSLTWLWISMIVAVILASVGVGVWAIVRDTGGISVPSVVGKTQAQAKATLSEAGLELEVGKTVRDASQPADVIVSQDPSPGSQLQKGGTVKVVVNEGEDLVNVPSVVGLSPSEAEAVLQEADLELGDTTESSSTQVAKGKILSQSPAAGEKTARGGSVSIVVSKGPESANVPNVVGLSQSTATQRLEEAGFQVQVQTQSSSTATEGAVLEQNPAAGQSTPKGSTVTITVAKDPPKVPNVVGKLQADAENTLVAAGFLVTVINQATTDQSKVGRVMSQDPTANSDAGPGASVKIYVGVTR